MIGKIKSFLNKGDNRTSLIKKNVLFSFLLKIIGMSVMFILIPLSINYLGSVNYGIWITISSIIAWTGMFDFGFAHGLRNKLTEALAQKDTVLGRYLISSSYLFILLIAVVLLVSVLPLLSLINWQSLLNLPNSYDSTMLISIIKLIFIFFILQFSLKPINAILQAHQWPSIAQAMGTVGGVMTVIGLFLLNRYSHFESELFTYALLVAGIPIVIELSVTLYLFYTQFKLLRPSFQFIKVEHVKSVAGLGMGFFIIQLSLLFVYSSDNLIISYLFGPAEVTEYNVVYRYFSIITLFLAVIMAPFWSAITDAYSKSEMPWIEKNIKILLKILIGSIVLDILLVLLSSWVFSKWISSDFVASFHLVLLMALYVICMGWLNIFSFFSNGIGKIRMQTIVYIFVAILNLPLSFYFGKTLEMGSSGVLLATIISMIIVSTILTIQYRKIITNQAQGLWNK